MKDNSITEGDNIMNLHEGHRDRKREQFLRCGADSFADHELLEILLFYAVPQRDTNPIAHALMDKFGTLQAVLTADPEELMEVPYVKDRAAVLIRLIPALYQRVLLSGADSDIILDTRERIGEFFQGIFATHANEVMYQLCLDGKGKKKGLYKICEGELESVGFNVRQIMENALRSKAVMVVLAHNHPSGVATPSREDCAATKVAGDALAAMGVRLVDHFVVADNDFVSMADSGWM